jgi:hypothetical protein
MNPDIEKILLAQAAREAEQQPQLNTAIAVGSGGGAALGALVGSGLHPLGKMVGNLRGTNHMMKPGIRFAGGLVGALLGGGLGAAAQRQAISEPTGAGALLAKIQAQGGVTLQDEAQLENVLRDAYSQMGILG